MQTSKLYLLICLAAEMTSAQNEKQTSYTSEETGRTAKLEMKAERTDGQIFEGDQVSLQCQVTGNPVGWTYELYEPKYIKIYETKAESTFTISSASLLHRGEYWCRAVKGNLYSLESNRVTLQVSESPVATLTPSNTHMYIGDKLNLDCKIDGSFTGWEYQWYKRDKKATDKHFETSSENTYTFEAVTESDSGEYLCSAYKADSPHSSKKSSAVTVTVEGRTAKLEMKAEHTDGQIFEGDQVSLQCQVTGNPVGWTYELYKSKYIKIYETKEESTFTISSASLSYKGEYWCRAVKGNLYSLESNRVTLQVSGRTAKLQMKAERKDGKIFEGDQVSLQCQVTGNPVGWTYELYTNKNQYKKNAESTFTISSVILSHRGEYWCKAVNGKLYSVQSNRVKLQVSERPKVTVKLTNEKKPVYIGDTVTLKCSTESGFTDWNYYLWYKGDQTYRGNQIYGANGQIYTLSLVTDSDRGVYRCSAQSGVSPRYSQISSPFTLAVKENPKTEVKLNNEEKPIYMGDTVTLKCNIKGGFTGWNFYHWFKGSQKYLGNQINGVTGQTYTFQLVTQSDKGSYRCKAYSDSSPRYSQFSHPVTLTTHERTARLEVTPVQIFEGDLVHIDCQVDGDLPGWTYELYSSRYRRLYKTQKESNFAISPVTLSDSGNYKCRAEKDGLYSKYSGLVWLQVSERTAKLALNSKQIFEGDQVILYCQVDGDPAGWKYEFWWNGSEQPYKSDMKSNFIISPVNVLHSGVYKCRAGKEGLYSKYSNDVQLQVSERTAKLTLNLKLIFEGDQVILYCQVDGDPAGWKYELCRNGCGKPYKSDVESTFTISPVNVSHSGVYKCRAGKGGIYSKYSNDVQLQVSGIWVTLSASPSSYVKIGNSLNLICTHSGNKIFHSTLTFIFLRNNETIKSSSDSKVLTINQFNESHTGSYKCGVESAGGGKTYSNEIEIKVQEIRLPVILVAGGLGLFLLILLPFLIVYHRTRGLPCSGSKSARTHKKVADTNTPIGGAVQMDTLNTGEVLYSELVNPPKGKKKGDSATKADSGVVYSDLIIGKLKKRKPGKEPTGTQEVLYSDIKLKNVTGDSAAESGDPVYSNIVIEKSVEKKKKKKDAPPADDPGALYASVLPKKGKK
ncbi:Fc receptor-like protein 5 isoform X2 [Polypterus senegalus]|uniref:Fc receptor-like protein 5 isoform X2 n=1 Tax=Polypterus senegalus TaxID=55291 RepID=UPI001963C0CF|nr:Fc receptor-like protein 5 isoform X2 [Polypterus senegalus]